MKNSAFFSLVAALAFSASAGAQSVLSYDATFGQPTPLSVGAPNFPVTITLPKFDSSLGTLQTAAITLSSTMTGAVDVINFTSSPQSFSNAFASMTITVTGPGSTTTSVTPTVTVASGIANSPAFTVTHFGALTNSANNSVNAGPLNLYQATGGGTLNLVVDSSAFGTYGGTGIPGTVAFSGSASAGGDVKIDYHFAPIPESSTFAAVLGLVVLGYALLRRSLRVGTNLAKH